MRVSYPLWPGPTSRSATQLLSFTDSMGGRRRDGLAELAAELVGSKVDVIHTTSTPAAPAARPDATTTIPIVFSAVGDPVGTGSCQATLVREET
jgi:ABC-type uncharacterized transport system substrate-binding protein